MASIGFEYSDDIHISDEEIEKELMCLDSNDSKCNTQCNTQCNTDTNHSIQNIQNNTNHSYYYDTNQHKLKLKMRTPFGEEVSQVKNQIKSIEQRIKQWIESNGYPFGVNESHSFIKTDINSNAIIDEKCSQRMDWNESSVCLNPMSKSLKDSKTKQTYDLLNKCFEAALDHLKCDQMFASEEWYLNLNYCFVECVLNEFALKRKKSEVSNVLLKLIQDINHLDINVCDQEKQVKSQTVTEVSVQTHVKGELISEKFFIE